jgi:alkanesulfonate monooxygenase SsuD/methylene tetrahydromethanopterin reductase-like flavin-dependent oxidoreductase (luciferase family)
LPAVEQGARDAGRSRKEIAVSVTAFVIFDEYQEEFVRQQIAFYASTPSYRPVMALHGWEGTAEELSALAARGQWGEMPGLITKEMLEKFATIAAADELPAALKNRYHGTADRLSLYKPFLPDDNLVFWERFMEAWS